ncbi:MAG: hypothetical protein QM762_14695 [Chryseolinea sp.]
MSVDKEKVAVILLGSQSFPQSKNFQSSVAFFNSYKKILGLFTDNYSLKIQAGNLLDLFNSELGPNEQDLEVGRFIENQHTNGVTDIIIYYIGHGGYASQHDGYVLAIKTSRDINLGASSITMKTLAVTISKIARKLRTYIILDCCFSAEAKKMFQSPVADILQKTVNNNFPADGVALLCSSSSDDPSLISLTRQITMFSESFEKALRIGSSSINSRFLTLRQLQEITFQNLKCLNPGEAVRPEIHSPHQGSGDLAEAPFFPNLGYKIDGYDISQRKQLVFSKIIINDLQALTPAFMDFVQDFDLDRRHEITMVLISAECNDLENDFRNVKDENDTQIARREKLRTQRNALYSRILEIINDIFNQKV